MISKFGVRCILLNTRVEKIGETHQRILRALSEP
jgi:hypothetical protein